MHWKTYVLENFFALLVLKLGLVDN